MSNPFIETRFDPSVIPKGLGGIVYKTTVVRTGTDLEKRNINQSEYLFEGDFGEVLLNARWTTSHSLFQHHYAGSC